MLIRHEYFLISQPDTQPYIKSTVLKTGFRKVFKASMDIVEKIQNISHTDFIFPQPLQQLDHFFENHEENYVDQPDSSSSEEDLDNSSANAHSALLQAYDAENEKESVAASKRESVHNDNIGFNGVWIPSIKANESGHSVTKHKLFKEAKLGDPRDSTQVDAAAQLLAADEKAAELKGASILKAVKNEVEEVEEDDDNDDDSGGATQSISDSSASGSVSAHVTPVTPVAVDSSASTSTAETPISKSPVSSGMLAAAAVAAAASTDDVTVDAKLGAPSDDLAEDDDGDDDDGDSNGVEGELTPTSRTTEAVSSVVEVSSAAAPVEAESLTASATATTASAAIAVEVNVLPAAGAGDSHLRGSVKSSGVAVATVADADAKTLKEVSATATEVSAADAKTVTEVSAADAKVEAEAAAAVGAPTEHAADDTGDDDDGESAGDDVYDDDYDDDGRAAAPNSTSTSSSSLLSSLIASTAASVAASLSTATSALATSSSLTSSSLSSSSSSAAASSLYVPPLAAAVTTPVAAAAAAATTDTATTAATTSASDALAATSSASFAYQHATDTISPYVPGIEIFVNKHGAVKPAFKKGPLTCGGKPLDSEVIYWRDVSGDKDIISPIIPVDEEYKKDMKYLSFEYDAGGWNNMRMSMECLIVLAHAFGRTLVLPPTQHLYLLSEKFKDAKSNRSNDEMGFEDFFNVDVMRSQKGMTIMSMKTFLEREGVTGRLHGKLPPGNRTDIWGRQVLWPYLTEVCIVHVLCHQIKCSASLHYLFRQHIISGYYVHTAALVDLQLTDCLLLYSLFPC